MLRDISSKNFNEICKAKRAQKWNIRFSLYLYSEKLLIITITTSPREVLHRRISDEIAGEVRTMDLQNELVSMGKTRYYQLNNAGTQIAKGEGDSVFKPRTFRQRGRD